MKQKDILFLLISAFILVIAWIIFSIYHKSITSTISETLSVQIVPINPNFDATTLEKIKERNSVAPLYQIQQIPTPTPSLQISPTQTGSPSASQINIQSQESTQGGSLTQ